MSLVAIIAALQPVIADVDGINAVLKRIPDAPPPEADEPFAVIEARPGRIEFAQSLRIYQYPVDLHVMTPRRDDLGGEFDVLLPFVNSVPDRLVTAFTLGGRTFGTDTEDPSYEFMDAQIGDRNYLDLVFHLRYKEKINASYSG